MSYLFTHANFKTLLNSADILTIMSEVLGTLACATSKFRGKLYASQPFVEPICVDICLTTISPVKTPRTSLVKAFFQCIRQNTNKIEITPYKPYNSLTRDISIR